jgi:hypothetical protein
MAFENFCPEDTYHVMLTNLYIFKYTHTYTYEIILKKVSALVYLLCKRKQTIQSTF